MRQFPRFRNFKFGLSFKISLLFSILFILLVSSISFFIYYTSYAKIENYIITSLSALANSKAEYIKNIIREDFEDVNILASNPEVKKLISSLSAADDLSKNRQIDILRDIVASDMKVTGALKDVDIFDNKGALVFSTRSAFPVKHVLPRGIFKICSVSYMSDPYWRNKVMRYDITFPVCADNEVVGALRASIDASKLYDIISDRTGMGKTGEITLGRRKGGSIIILVATDSEFDPFSRVIVPITSKIAEPLRHAVMHKDGFVTGLDYKGREVIAAYRSLPVNNWGLVVKTDKREAFKIIYEFLKRIIIIGAIALFTGILVITILTRALLRPVKILESAMNNIASGDFDHRVNIDTSDEISSLAGYLNDMAARLKVITVSRDVLNQEVELRKRSEEKLKEAAEAKSKFTSMISHELRTPLTAISEGIKIVRDGIIGRINDEQKDCLRRASNNVDRLSRLIKDILEYQKLDAGKMTFNMAEHDLNKIIRNVYETMAPQIKNKSVEFIFRHFLSLPHVRADKDKIEQVVSNLVSNSIKFTKKGSIIITIKHEEKSARVSVKDTGCGIKKEDMARLFQYFEQVGDAADRREGSGLGLAISKEIITGHSGRVWAESEYGKGTTIYFTLPLVL